MISRAHSFSPTLMLLAGAVTLGGCVAPGSRDAAVLPRPTMPTIAPGASAPRNAATEAEIAASALQLARAGDMAGATSRIRRAETADVRVRLATQVGDALAESNVTQAAAFATALAPGGARIETIHRVGRTMAQRDPDAAVRWAMGLEDVDAQWSARRAVASQLVTASPRGAVDRIVSFPAGAARDDVLSFAVAAWARQDADAALGWVRALPDEALRQRLTSTAVFEIAQAHPNRAVALAETLPTGRDRWLMFSAIAQTWVAVDPKAAVEWANQLPAGEPREAAFAGVEAGFGLPSSRRAGNAPGIRTTRRVLGGGGRPAVAMPEIDSPGFAAWLATQSQFLSREEAILEYVRQRGALEPATVGQWIASLPGDPTRTRAVELYLQNVIPTAPVEAENFLRSIPRSDLSPQLVEETARRWLQTNPMAAEQWLRDSMLPPDRKEQLLREAGRLR